MPSRVERVSRFSARPAASYIERSTRSQLQRITKKTENEKGLKNYGNCGLVNLGFFPFSEVH
jgi:hypothetical protein